MIDKWIGFGCPAAACILLACGGAQQGEPQAGEGTGGAAFGEGDTVSSVGPAVTQIDLATALNASGLKLAAPSAKEFLPDTATVYLLATLEKLPREADIEVRWTQSTMGSPISVTHASGSGTYTFNSQFDLAKFVAGEKKPYGEKIQALIFVNNRQVGGTLFTISDRRSGGMLRVKDLAVSGAVESGSNLAVNSTKSFRKGTKKVIASFYVGGLEPGATMRVRWLHEEELVKEDDLESEGEKRYAAAMENGKGLAFGDWTVEIDINGDVFASRSFFMGDDSSGAAIEDVALGTALGKNRMPKKAMTSFKPNVGAIHCGVQFLYARADAKIEIQWVSLTEGVENILQTTETTVNKEGPTTVNMAWRPGKSLPVGPYKAAVVVDGVKTQEIAFEVQ